MENAQSLSTERIMAAFGEWPYFSGGFRWVQQRPWHLNCNQAKTSQKEPMSAVPRSLGEDP